MTISSTTARNDYVAAGGTSFAYTFRILVQTELKVYVAGVLKTLTSDYTVSGVGDGAGGSVDFIVAPTAGLAVAIVDEPDFLQETDYIPNDAFPASAHEDALDKLSRIVLYLKNRLNQSLLLPLYSTLTGLTLPTPAALNFLRWNATATNLENAALASSGVFSYTAWGYAMMNSATSAAGMTNLGMSNFAQALLDDTTSASFQQSIGLGYVTQQAGALSNLGFKVYPHLTDGSLTIYALTATHATPTANDPIVIGFPSTTSTGSQDLVNITSAISTTISSGQGLGFQATKTGRIYLGLINQAGNAAIAFARVAGLFPEGQLITTYVPGVDYNPSYSTSTTTTPQTKAYSTTTGTSVANRLAGYFEVQAATATGTWSSTAPSTIKVMTPGMRKTGDVVQSVYNTIMGMQHGVTALPIDGTVPQITEGDHYFSQAITSSSVCNILKISADVTFGNGSNNLVGVAFFKGNTAASIASFLLVPTTGNAVSSRLEYEMLAETNTSTTFSLRAGGVSGTTYLNGLTGPASLFTNVPSKFKITEIFA